MSFGKRYASRHESFSCVCVQSEQESHKDLFRLEMRHPQVFCEHRPRYLVFYSLGIHSRCRHSIASQEYRREFQHTPSQSSPQRGGRKKGLPLGNLTSQLLVNIYMNEFDQFVKHKLKARYYIRYADDFVVLSESKTYLESLLANMGQFLSTWLHLELHPDKVFIKTLASGVDFLGWVHFFGHRVLRTSTKRRMFRSLEQTQNEQSAASYLGLLKHGNAFTLQKRMKKSYSSIDAAR